MVENIITFSADQQRLVKTGGISKYASDTVSYITATFDLGDNWAGFDEVRAVFKTPFDCRTAVLNSLGECEVPREILCYKAVVRVNLVGSVYTEESVVDRLTTYSCEALEITEDVPVGGNESAPLSPSEYEQFVANVAEDADRAEAGATSAESSAQSAGESAESAEQSADDALRYSQNSEASAIRSSGYAQSASNSATEAETAKGDAEDARDEIRAMRATATTLAEGSDATASYSNGVLSLGIPRGNTGSKGDTGDPAGFGTVSATVDNQTGTPSVEVTTSGTDTAKNFDFAFHNLKGEKGDKGDTGEVSYADLSTLLPTDTASGAIASFPDGQSVIPAVSVIAEIEPIQDLNGYDHPWSGGAGKNKVDISTISVPANTDTTVVLEEVALKAGTYTLSYTLNKTITATRNRPLYSIGSASTYGDDIKTAGRGSWTFTLAEDSTITLKWWYHTVSEACTISDFQLESGSTASAWTPYSNECPISGHTECVTEQRGKNLLDISKVNSTDKYIDIANNYWYTAPIKLKPNTQYTISPSSASSLGVSDYWVLYINPSTSDEDYLVITNPAVKYPVESGLPKSITFTTGATGTIRFGVTTVSGAPKPSALQAFMSVNWQIELGSTATTYESYNGTTHTTDLGRTVYGGEAEIVGGVLTDKMGYIASYNGETIGEPWISDRDEYVAGTTPSIGAEVVYTLATPQTYQLTPTEIALLQGQNNVWCDTGEIEVTYKADVGLYIDKKLNV